MRTLDRIHNYLHDNARTRAIEVVPFGSVTLYLGTVISEHDIVALVNDNDQKRLALSLANARTRVEMSGGQTHVRIVEELFPAVPPIVDALGFREVKRERLLTCTPDILQPARDVHGLTFVTLTSDSPLGDVQLELDINERGFDPDFRGLATEQLAARFRSTLDTARAFTAHLDGEAVAAGMFHRPINGVTQCSGIATIETFRRRGISSALTTHMTRIAFESGVDLIYLAAANDAALRVYERIGYRQVGTLIVYDDTATGE